MSFIKINLSTDKEKDGINIDMKSECTMDELHVAVVYLMTGLAANTSIEILEELVEEIRKDLDGNDKD